MDYPISDPSSNLYGGKFYDGNPGGGIPASVDKSAHMNAVYDELRNLISAAGLVPDEGVFDQVATAVLLLITNTAIPIGFPAPWPHAEPPTGWLVRDGGEYARNTYPKLFNATHPSRTGTTTNGSAVVTGLSRTNDLHEGMSVEYGAVNTTISSIDSGSQITLAAPAAVTGSRTLWFFYYGRPANGNNFYLPDDRAAFERMWDSGAGINPGRPFGSLELDALQGHNHAISQAMETPQGGSQVLAGRIDPSNSYRVSRTRDEFVVNGSYGTPRIAGETRPYNRAYLPIIRAY